MKKLILTFAILLFAWPCWGTTYYMRADGTAANKAAASGPCGTQANCMSIATHDADTYSGDDIIILCDDGGVYRDQMDIPSSGSDGSPISYEANVGDTPIISGADIIGTWTAYSGSWAEIWDAETQTGDNTWGHAGSATDRNYRVVIKNASITASATTIRVKLKGDSIDDLTVEDLSIGVRHVPGAGDAFDIDSVQNLQQGLADSWTLNSGTSEYTDSVVYSINSAIDYLVCINVPDPHSYAYLSGSSPATYWKVTPNDETETLDVAGYGTSGDFRIIETIESLTAQANTWQAALATEPNQVFFDSTRGTNAGSIAAINSTGEWFWAANVLYVYHTQDPDGDIVIEASIRTNCIRLLGVADDDRYDYITIKDLKLKYANTNGIVVKYANNAIIDNVLSEYNYNSGIYVGAADDVLIKESELSYSCISHGIYLDGAELLGTDDPTVEYCELHHNSTDGGIQLNGNGVYQVQNPIIRYNYFHDNYYGILDLSSDGGKYYGNIFVNSIGRAIGLKYDTGDDAPHAVPSENSVVYNNTIYTDGLGIEVGAFSTGHTIKNNIIYRASGADAVIEIEANATATVDYNLYYPDSATSFDWQGVASDDFADWKSDSSGDANSISSDPLFTNAGADDFTLQATSPCIDAGVRIPGADYKYGLLKGSVWPGGVLIGDQDTYGNGWEIGVYIRQMGLLRNLIRNPVRGLKTNLMQ